MAKFLVRLEQTVREYAYVTVEAPSRAQIATGALHTAYDGPFQPDIEWGVQFSANSSLIEDEANPDAEPDLIVTREGIQFIPKEPADE